MQIRENSMSRLMEVVGTVTTICWVLFLGPLGALLLLGTWCAFVLDEPPLGLACALAAAVPALLGAVWLLLGVIALIVPRDRRMGIWVAAVHGQRKRCRPLPMNEAGRLAPGELIATDRRSSAP